MRPAHRTNDPAGLRRRIVDAAFERFTRHGFNATAMQDVRAAAGVSGGAFSHHFPTKKALGLAVIRDRVAAAVEAAWIEPVVRAPDALAGIGAAFEAVIAELEAGPSVSGCPLNNLAVELSRQDEEMRVEMAAIFARWHAAILDKLVEDDAAGHAPPVDAAAFAALVVAGFSGAMAMAKAAQTAQPLKDCWRALRGMTAAAEAGETSAPRSLASAEAGVRRAG